MPPESTTRATTAPRRSGSEQPVSLDWITRLLRVDTTSRDSNLPLIELVVDELRACGVEPVLVHNEDGTKANLLATFPAAPKSATVVSTDGAPAT